MNSVMMDTLSWVDYHEKLQRDRTVVLLPCGATEQHGPHLPLGTDSLLPTAIAKDVATQIDGLVAPTLNYGYKSQLRSGGGQHFPGTTSLDGHSQSLLVRDLIRELSRHGVQFLVLINGHYENQWFLTEGIDLALRELGDRTAIRIMRLEYWQFLSEPILEQVFPDGCPDYALEHAAVIETSLMLHYYPNLVQLERIPTVPPVTFPVYDLYPPCKHWVPESGVLSSAKTATSDKGKLMANQIVVDIIAAIRHEFLRP